MKQLLLFLLLLNSSLNFGQNTLQDSINSAYNLLISTIQSELEQFDQNGDDYAILMKYDSMYPTQSTCNFIVRRDSCTNMYCLAISDSLTTYYIGIGRISRRSTSKPHPCADDISIIEQNLSRHDNYFTQEKPEDFQFEQSHYTFFVKIKDQYILETFGKEFFSKHHPGMLHYTICYAFGTLCTY